ncbi:MAG: helix-turn-helix transcriptional regulator [Myxococcales bacterium]|nr:helix-turn-helix transcriptional regulator [Myxococcales bacterium]
MLERIGATVAHLRAERGWTVTELARQADCPADVIERLERGERGLTTTQLAALAASLEVDVQALRAGRTVPRPAPSVFLLHQGLRDFHDDDLPALDRAITQARVLTEITGMLGTTPAPWPTRRLDAASHSSDAAAKQAYQLAIDLRRHLAEPSRPFDDLVEVIEDRLGVVVVVERLSAGGACAVVAGGARAIVLDADTYADAVGRARVALAHELCHVLHDPQEAGVHIVLDREADRSAHANEQRARAHAAELLLPLAGLHGLLGLPAQVDSHDAAVALVARAMDHFGTPWQLTANHLVNRRFVARNLREWLEAAASHGPPATPMRMPPAGGPSLAVRRNVELAHRAGHVTDGEARAMLGLRAIAPLPWDQGQ